MTIVYDNMSPTSRSKLLFSKCCFCIPLRIGCFILGYISLLINIYHTLLLVGLAVNIALYTSNVDPAPKPVSSSYDEVPAVETDQSSLYTMIGIIFIVGIVINVLWVIINIACLVGLHRRRPGPVRVYIRCAIMRLMLTIAGFVQIARSGDVEMDTIITYSIDLVFAAYFLLVYYVYTQQLERENAERIQNSEVPINDTGFTYPTNLDKEQLVV